MKVKYADIHVGIWDTAMELRYGRTRVTLVLPYVRWTENNGSLAIEKIKLKVDDHIVLSKLFDIYESNPLPLREYLAENFYY